MWPEYCGLWTALTSCCSLLCSSATDRSALSSGCLYVQCVCGGEMNGPHGDTKLPLLGCRVLHSLLHHQLLWQQSVIV